MQKSFVIALLSVFGSAVELKLEDHDHIDTDCEFSGVESFLPVNGHNIDFMGHSHATVYAGDDHGDHDHRVIQCVASEHDLHVVRSDNDSVHSEAPNDEVLVNELLEVVKSDNTDTSVEAYNEMYGGYYSDIFDGPPSPYEDPYAHGPAYDHAHDYVELPFNGPSHDQFSDFGFN